MPEFISPLELVDVDDPPEGPETPDDVDLVAVRELVLRAHPDVVPELIAGDSVADMLASVEAAQAAYTRLSAAWSEANPQPVPVPAGGGAAIPVDPEKLPASEKIRRGLKAANRRQGREG